MTENEKRMAGELYFNKDPDIKKDLEDSRLMCYLYNQINPNNYEEKRIILKKLLGQIEGSFYIEQPFRCDFGKNIFLGDNFYSNYNLTILDCNEVHIGKNCLIGPNVSIFTVGHPIDCIQRRQSLEYAYPVKIGNDVWIGGGVIINPGVIIGDNVIIGSGSVVTKNIPDNVMAVGNPCEVIKKIK